MKTYADIENSYADIEKLNTKSIKLPPIMLR